MKASLEALVQKHECVGHVLHTAFLRALLQKKGMPVLGGSGTDVFHSAM